MAYLIFENKNLIRIAANENDKNSLNTSEAVTVVEVSESDFLQIKSGRKGASYDGTNVTYIDFYEDPNEKFDPLEQGTLEFFHKNIIEQINNFLEMNPDNSMRDSITAYKTFLEGFDCSTITYPMTKSWEQHCQDNSITYFHPLQIP